MNIVILIAVITINTNNTIANVFIYKKKLMNKCKKGPCGPIFLVFNFAHATNQLIYLVRS
jgi:hypothetical protein